MGNSINVDKLSKICLEFTNYLENCKAIFNNIDLEMVSIDTNFSSQCKQDITNLYSTIKENYPIIEANIMSFVDDLRNVINGRELLDIELSERVVNDIDKLYDRSDY